jgi:multiple sugar transport system ATP-binding protein
LEIVHGEFIAILGPSGCGKTTTLRMILGLLQPTSGRLLIDGTVVNDWGPKQRNVGIVFQDYAIFPHMYPYDNIAFGLRMAGMSRATIEEEVSKVAEMLSLGEILHRPVSGLNVGELQRVAIARTLVTKPEILLLDEPLSNLEPFLRARMRTELKRLVRELKQTAIYVTHDQVEAMSLADRIAIMNMGVLQQVDSPRNVYQHPKNRFVAEFIGSPSMNLIECGLHVDAGRWSLVRKGLRWDVTSHKSRLAGKATADRLLFGIRPEHIRVGEGEANGTGTAGVTCTVEPLGSETILDVRVDDVVLRVLVDPKFATRVGETVYLDFPREKVHILDVDTGRTIV